MLPSLIVAELLAILTVYSFLILSLEPVTSTSDTNSLGILANSPGSPELSNSGRIIVTPLLVIFWPATIVLPSQIPAIVVIPATVMKFCVGETAVTLLKIWSVSISCPVNLTISFTLTPVNLFSGEVMVAIPVETPSILKSPANEPKAVSFDSSKSAANVVPEPTILIDLASSNPWLVTVSMILESNLPLI